MFEFIAPGSILQFSAADEAGAFANGDVENSKLQFRLFHGLTPETDTTCFYFWSTANGFRPNDPAATEAIVQGDRSRLQRRSNRCRRPASPPERTWGATRWSISPPMPPACTCGEQSTVCWPRRRGRWRLNRRSLRAQRASGRGRCLKSPLNSYQISFTYPRAKSDAARFLHRLPPEPGSLHGQGNRRPRVDRRDP